MKAFMLGACDYWIKPLHDNQFEDMWIHVCKKYISEDKMQEDIGSMKVEDYDKIREISDNPHFDLSYHNLNESKNNNASSTTKIRVVWSPELHCAFLKAIQEVGIESMIILQLIYFLFIHCISLLVSLLFLIIFF